MKLQRCCVDFSGEYAESVISTSNTRDGKIVLTTNMKNVQHIDSVIPVCLTFSWLGWTELYTPPPHNRSKQHHTHSSKRHSWNGETRLIYCHLMDELLIYVSLISVSVMKKEQEGQIHNPIPPASSGHRPSSAVLSDGAQAQSAERRGTRGEGEWKLQQPFYKAVWKELKMLVQQWKPGPSRRMQ